MIYKTILKYASILCLSLCFASSYSLSEKVNIQGLGPQQQQAPWMNKSLSVDHRTDLLLREMTQQEKLQLVFGYFAADVDRKNYTPPKTALPYSAGYVPGIPRLGIPSQFQTDAGMGVATQPGAPTPRARTALPAGIAIASSWNPDISFNGGKMIGAEARASGFNVMLAGSVNLQREPRNGRNFEYAGEDPLLAGTIVGQQIKGVQSNNIVSSIKHFALNSQETGRGKLSADIPDAAARMSDLLAFQLAIEIGNPGAVMCGYNRVNGYYACESDYLLNQVLKNDWGYKGYVMSDWGAVHSTTQSANHGLDQQSGYPFDAAPYFGEPLKEAVEQGWVPQARLDNMVFRILRSFFSNGVMDHPVVSESKIDFDAHAKITLTAAEESIILLKNQENILPLSKDLKKIAIIGGHADVGVLAGGGSSNVYPVGGNAVPGLSPTTWPGPVIYFPSSPMRELKQRLSKTKIRYADGVKMSEAVELAKSSDVAIVFVSQWMTESLDAKDLYLPDNQDALIAAIAEVNPNTVVILQNGTPLFMPWLSHVSAVVEAWYPGSSGGEAIAKILSGEVNPSGHLPVTFPASQSQLPRPVLDGNLKNDQLRFHVNYFEGAAVGYKWFDLQNHKPLFPFGFGLSYTEFSTSNLNAVVEKGELVISFDVKNVGKLSGKDVPQIYMSPVDAVWEAPTRLIGWHKVALRPGQQKNFKVSIDPRVLAVYESDTKHWHISEGDYKVILADHHGAANAESLIIHLENYSLDVNGHFLKKVAQ